MKITNYVLVVCVLMAFATVSCRQKTIRTIEKSVMETHYLSNDSTKGALSVEINIELPVCYDNTTTLNLIRNSIVTNLFGEEYIAYHNDSIASQFVHDLKREYLLTNAPILNEMDNESLYSFNNEHVLDGFSLISDEKMYSYGINRYVFMGGAHGLNTINYYNYNLETGKLITEDDIFQKNSSKKLTEIIKRRIVEQSIENSDVKPIKTLENSDYWTSAIRPNGNFYIADESINYIFNPYEIGPYYLGITEVNIPFERLKSILKPRSIISHLLMPTPPVVN